MPTRGGLTGAKSATWRVSVLNNRTLPPLLITAPHDTRHSDRGRGLAGHRRSPSARWLCWSRAAAGRPWVTGRSSPECIEQRAADICDVDYSGQTGAVDNGQMPETAGNHGVSRLTDGRRRLDDTQARGHQLKDPDRIWVPPIRHQLDKIRLRDKTYRPIGLRVHEHQSGHTLAPHQVRGRGHMVIRLYRRHRRMHNVGDTGRGG